MDIILLITQVLTLIALIIYVVKTWHIASSTKESAIATQHMLEEMKESRDQELAPYVVAYFDIPYGKPLIYFCMKNIGKTVAHNVKLEFTPPLQNSRGNEIYETALIRDGIGSLPPGYEIKTLFDSAISYYGNENLPLNYASKVTYTGGLLNLERATKQNLDLSAFKGLHYTNERGLHDLVCKIEELVRHIKKTNTSLQESSENLNKRHIG